MQLKGKICLITGSTGIAEATAELAVRAGAMVFLTSLTEEHGHTLVHRLRQEGGDCEFTAANLTEASAVDKAVQGCIARFQRVDALFNVAGISGRKFGDGPVHECTEAGWDGIMEANVRSQFLMCRAVIRQMLTQTPGSSGLRGAILNMASVLGFSPSTAYFATHAYAASKGAIISLSRAMAAFYAPQKIRVNVIAPALARTPMSQRAQSDAHILRFLKTKQPLLENLIEPESIARAALFLMSDDASAITGDLLTVDAGWCVSEGQVAQGGGIDE